MLNSYAKTRSGVLGYSKLRDEEGTPPFRPRSIASLANFERLRSQKSLSVLYGRLRSGRSEESMSSTSPGKLTPAKQTESPSKDSSSTEHDLNANPFDAAGSPKEKSTSLGRQFKRTTLTDSDKIHALRRSAGHGDLKCFDDEAIKSTRSKNLSDSKQHLPGTSGLTTRPSSPISPTTPSKETVMSPRTRQDMKAWELSAVRTFPKRWSSQGTLQGSDVVERADQGLQAKKIFNKIKRILGNSPIRQVDTNGTRELEGQVKPNETRQLPYQQLVLPKTDFNAEGFFEKTDNSAIDKDEDKKELSRSEQTNPKNMPIYESMRSGNYSANFEVESSSSGSESSHTDQDGSSQNKHTIRNENKIQQLMGPVRSQEMASSTPVSRHVKWSSEVAVASHKNELLPEIDFHDSGFFDSSMLQTSTPRRRLEPAWSGPETNDYLPVPRFTGTEYIRSQDKPIAYSDCSTIGRNNSNSLKKKFGLEDNQKLPVKKMDTGETADSHKESLKPRSQGNVKRTDLGPKDVNTNRKSAKTAMSRSESKAANGPGRKSLENVAAVNQSGIPKDDIPKPVPGVMLLGVTPPPRASSKAALSMVPVSREGGHNRKTSSIYSEQAVMDGDSSIDPLQLDLSEFRIKETKK